jgi:NDP-sugar pyrophosphorylase family protein
MDGNAIKEFLEKPQNPPGNYVSSGLYILDPNIFKYADPTRNLLMIEYDVFPFLAKQGELFGCKMENSRWYDCGTMERWEKAIKEW